MDSMVFTMDVEDWHHSENIKPWLSKTAFNHSSVYMVEEVLKVLDEKKARGTFFFLGQLAAEVPGLVREVSAAGHEVANHGWDHQLLSDMTETETLNDLKRSTETIEAIVSEKVVGYRSPCFSQNPYVFDTLAALGYTYTSMGIKSTFHDRYASNSVLQQTHLQDYEMPVARLLGVDIPCTGGGWFRMIPVWAQQWLLAQSMAKQKVFYCHPWDFDGNQPFLDKLPWRVKFRHAHNSSTAISRLSQFNFGQHALKDLAEQASCL